MHLPRVLIEPFWPPFPSLFNIKRRTVISPDGDDGSKWSGDSLRLCHPTLDRHQLPPDWVASVGWQMLGRHGQTCWLRKVDSQKLARRWRRLYSTSTPRLWHDKTCT